MPEGPSLEIRLFRNSNNRIAGGSVVPVVAEPFGDEILPSTLGPQLLVSRDDNSFA